MSAKLVISRILLVIGLALVGGSPDSALARQGDERLDPLFDRLRQSDIPVEIAAIEQRIWQIWLQSGSDTIDLLMQRGVQAMGRGDLDAALKQFDAIVEMDPELAEGWNKRATAQYLIGNYEASVSDIARTLELEPRHFGALSGLGLIYDATDNPKGALQAYRRALAVHPRLQHPRFRVEALKKQLRKGDI